MRRHDVMRVMAVLVVAGAVGWLNVALLWEAYGPDAPYYGRSTNMDKWVNPLPVLLMIDAVALAIGWLIWRTGKR